MGHRMNRSLASLLTLAVLAAGSLLAPPGARAASSIYTQVLRAYEQNGSVPPCQFSSAQLNKALQGIDTYGAQYFQDFSDAVQSALNERAGGACLPRRSATGAGAPAASAVSSPTGSVTAPTSAGVPLPLLVLAVLAVLAAAAAAGVWLVRWSAWRPAPLAAWQHGWREAEGRLETLWLELGDWLRSGADR